MLSTSASERSESKKVSGQVTMVVTLATRPEPPTCWLPQAASGPEVSTLYHRILKVVKLDGSRRPGVMRRLWGLR
jgi:hypothetical protein